MNIDLANIELANIDLANILRSSGPAVTKSQFRFKLISQNCSLLLGHTKGFLYQASKSVFISTEDVKWSQETTILVW